MTSGQSTTVTLSEPDLRQLSLVESGLQVLVALAERWAINGDARSRFVNGTETKTASVTKQLERVSHLLGIYRAATALFRHREANLLRWLRAANTAPPFSGSSPLQVILDGRNLNEIRGYLECQLVG